MTTSHKIYIAILFVALLVLAWDKTARQQSVTDPQPAKAQSRIQPPPTPSSQPSIEPLAPALENLGQKIQNFLPLPAERPKTTQTRNLFIASEQLLSLLDRNEHKNNASANLEEQLIQLKLSSIIILSRRQCAMINNEILFPGDTIGPYRLIEIRTGSVVLQFDSEQTTLPLDP